MKYIMVILFVLVSLGCSTKYNCPEQSALFDSPVCGVETGIMCVTYPCPKSIQTTYENSQAACEGSQYFTKGKCRTEGAKYGFFDRP